MKGVQAAVLGGSALVLLILALRLTLKDHLPRRRFPALWCTAAIRFLLPVEIPTRLSVWNLLRGTAEPQTAPIASALLPSRSSLRRRPRPPPERGRTGGCCSGSGSQRCLPRILQPAMSA